MCGIAGYCGRASRFSDEKLGAMLRAIEHRGPDDCGIHSEPLASDPETRVWLGSRRLAIQDLTLAGHQPMADAESGNVIAFNGEIYNFPELRAKLEREGVSFGSRCDTEVALRSWSRRGLAAVEEWRGIFGAAVWEPRTEELWLVRDWWGIKPLYYKYDREGIAFCSEVRGLLAAGMVARRLSRRGVEDYLRFGAPQDPVTIIDGVYALLPGHALRWKNGQAEIRRYAAPPQLECREADVEPMLREIVRQQLISDVPVVVFLSGGVDSSVVALAARQESRDPVHTMAVVFEEGGYSERQYARRVAAHIGAEHHEVTLQAEEARAKAVEAISRMDQPTVDGINTYVISEAARRAGFTVALSGLGGDEFFGGYETFFRARRVAQLQQMARRAPALAGLAGRALRLWKNEAAQKLSLYLEEGDFWEHPYFLQRTLFFPQQVEALCGSATGLGADAMADRMAEAERQCLLEEAEAMDPLNQVSLLEARTYMANLLLRDSDQMSMAHSLELRVPLVDHLLAARLLATPGERKGFGQARKLWLEQAFGRYLPAEVFRRKKMGFVLPFAVWLQGPLAQDVERALNGGDAGVCDRRATLQVWEGFRQGRVGWSRPWALYVLSQWAAEHIPGAGVTAEPAKFQA
ncbi:MAG TPA: asparagine synthase (glutamine-hydrolyzing) [Bryobacterales bacterium]|nr:asparagine synthase (glutamine-hydrolyzing) [Bryobacterales bacterium]